MIVRALTYFAIVFGLGFALGTARVLWLVPSIGEREAELIEMPFMLAGSYFAARWCVRRFPSPNRSEHLRSGLLALAVLVLFEWTVVLFLRGLTISDYIATRDPVAGSIYLASLLAFGLMPWAAARSH